MRTLSKLVGTVVRVDTCRRNAPRRRSMRWKNPPLRVRLAVRTQSWSDRSEATHEPTGADVKCSLGAPTAREGESVDIEIESGAEVSCFPANIGADTYPLHETRLSICGGHHVAAGGGKLQDLGVGGCKRARRCCEPAGTIQSHEHWQSTLDNTRSESLWFGRRSPLQAVEMRTSSGKASDTRITLMKKRCAWYLRVELHNELPYIESAEFLEEMSMDQRAGVWPVEEGGCSSSNGPGVPEDVEKASL